VASPVTISRPRAGDHAPYYSRYVDLVPDGNVIELLERQGKETNALLGRVDEQTSLFRYAPEKWSVREVVGHVADAERVFAYRAVTFARGDATALPGFDQDVWSRSTNANDRSLAELASELAAIRASTLGLLRGFGPAEVARGGTASDNHVTVGALAYIMAGHELHHVKILREKYGLK
jgi:hypothetical protein